MGRLWWVSLVALVAALGACSKSTPATSVNGGVGQPAAGKVAWRFVGHLDQNGGDFSGYGYLTQIDGLNDSQLYSSAGQQGEQTARFTVVITSHLTSRSKLQNVTIVNTSGTATVYYNDQPAGNFADPSSFAKGTAIAQAGVDGQNVLNINPNNRDQGIAAATAQLSQTSATGFKVDGTSHQFGRSGLVERMALNGEGTRTDPATPKSLIEVAGDIIVSAG